MEFQYSLPSFYFKKPPEDVWDYTQDYCRRKLWDLSVNFAKVIEQTPYKIVSLKSFGNQKMRFKYKQEKRPEKTSLSIIETNSFWLKGGGGSWVYKNTAHGTLWAQTNTVILRNDVFGKISKPLLYFIFHFLTALSMKRAKKIIETL